MSQRIVARLQNELTEQQAELDAAEKRGDAEEAAMWKRNVERLRKLIAGA